jgi:hypothetical protein
MKNKSRNLKEFIDGLHHHIITHRQFRRKTNGKSEAQIQTELRPIIVEYLMKWYKDRGIKDYEGKAHDSFYWEGQEGRNKNKRNGAFGAFNYPDFIITKPYNIAIEYKQSSTGSLVKQGIGQSVIHTMTGDHDYVYYLFHDQSDDKRVRESVNREDREQEKKILERLWSDFNVKLEII